MKIMRYLEQKGQGIVEYALILAFVVGIATYALSSDSNMGKAIKETFDSVTQQLGGTTGGGGNG